LITKVILVRITFQSRERSVLAAEHIHRQHLKLTSTTARKSRWQLRRRICRSMC